MKAQNKWVFLPFGLALVFLYLCSSTNLILREKPTQVYPVSVIMEESSDENYERLRKGMDRAAEEFHVDLNFITLFERNDQKQQSSLIIREITDGARAVIVSPAVPVQAAADLDGMVLNSPVILLGERMPNDQVKAGISVDYQEAGRLLGQAAAAHDTALPVYVLTEGLTLGYRQELYDGVVSALGTGHSVRLKELSSEEECRSLIESLVYPGEGQAVLVTLDEKSLDTVTSILSDSSVYQNYIAGFYGIGESTRDLYALDREIIDGLVVRNRYDEGYLSIRRAVEAIQGETAAEQQITLEVNYITKEDLRDERFEKMLYPMD